MKALHYFWGWQIEGFIRISMFNMCGKKGLTDNEFTTVESRNASRAEDYQKKSCIPILYVV